MTHSPPCGSLVLLLLGNAFFVGAEFAAMAARRSTLEPLAEQGSARARICLDALEQIGSMLATAQLGITVCSVGLGALAEAALHEMIESLFHAWHLADHGVSDAWSSPLALVLALLVVVYLHVVVGEMIPKNLAIAGPDRAALLLVPPLLWLARALRPVVRVMEALAKALVRLFRVEPKDEIASAFTAEEVAHIVAESTAEGLIEEERQGLVRSALEFSDKSAADVAVPVARAGHRRAGHDPRADRAARRQPRLLALPRDRRPRAQVDGYLHLKDVLYADDERHEQPVPAKRVRRLATVRPQDEVEDVLGTMQRTGAHLARVVGRDGAVTGVVFLEDVLEELVGEVSDATQR